MGGSMMGSPRKDERTHTPTQSRQKSAYGGPSSILKGNRVEKKSRPKTADRSRPSPSKINHQPGINFSPYSVPNVGRPGGRNDGSDLKKQVSFQGRQK